jgi:hypothetical protein
MMPSRPWCPAGALFRASSRPLPSRHTHTVKLKPLTRPLQGSPRAGLHFPAVANTHPKPHNLQPGKIGLHTTAYSAARSKPSSPSQRIQQYSKPGVCFRCGEVGHLARDCFHAKRCYRCGEPGHTASQCSSAVDRGVSKQRLCLRCGEVGHVARDCPHANRCYRCGEPGHAASQCSSAVDRRVCFVCKEVGHIAPECPRSRRRRRTKGGDSEPSPGVM